MKEKKNVFIIGSKGIPANYGGFETFVEKLTKYNAGDIQYHVACISDREGNYIYNHARCVQIKVPKIGSAKAVFYDCAAIRCFIRYCKEHKEIKQPVFYVLACRIGPFVSIFKKQIDALGGKLYVNPDGQEWKRRKWSKPVRWYWKYSENRMIRNADDVICDSQAIEAYIRQEYQRYKPKTCFIPYGAEKTHFLNQEKFQNWMEKRQIKSREYYVLIGRFVSENNFEIIIREFMNSDTKRKLLIITGDNNKLKKRICKNTSCQNDPRIVFAGTVYDGELLTAIRENAYASFHGHEVGGTNPSLLEGMLCTEVNLVLDVIFNREVGGDAVLYWEKEPESLQTLIQKVERMREEEREHLKKKSVARIKNIYSWEKIEESYRHLFMENTV